MSGGISIAIPLGFAVLAGVLCWYLTYTKGRWPLKLCLIALLSGFGLEVWSALDSYSGWPAREELPRRSLLIAAIMREPNPATRDPGAIFVWVQPLVDGNPDPFEYRPVSGEPRAYRLPYSRPTHEQMSQALQAMSQGGRPIVLERTGSPGGAPGQEGSGNGDTYDDEGTGIQMYELPPPGVPDKDAQPDPHGH